jgi:hypothetical protein
LKLRFFAREDALATVPGFQAGVGQAPSYIGRNYVKLSSGASFPACKEPTEVDTATMPHGTASRWIEHGRRGHIWCADKETAAVCDTEFVELTYKDGVWSRKPSVSK